MLALPSNETSNMYIKLWGVRGSIPTPITSGEYRSRLVQALQFAKESWQKNPDKPAANIMEELPREIATLIGGETTCVEIREGDDFLIIDMGTGARSLGYSLMAKGPPKEFHILMTHTHWDHIQGWPFFVPGYLPTSKLTFYSDMENLEERFVRQQNFEHFPVEFGQMLSERKFVFFPSGETRQIGPFEVASFNLRHPGGAAAYRIRSKGKTFIFATDTEYLGENLQSQIDASRDFFYKADLLVMDAQYSVEDAKDRIGWGHTPAANTIECARQWEVRHLVLTHHEPTYRDSDIMESYARGLKQMQADQSAFALQVEVGSEGSVFSL